jgi:hypothetical protein
LIALGLVAAGLTLFLWPIHAAGVHGNAIRPHYVPFGWTTYTPMPPHPTDADLRAAGIALPADTVNARRHLAGAVTAAGLLFAGATLIATSRIWAPNRPSRPPTDPGAH